MSQQIIVLFLIYWAVFGLIIGLVAKWKNRNGLLWAILGGPFLIIGLLIINFMPYLCPKCRIRVKGKQWKGKICPDCGSDLQKVNKICGAIINVFNISAISIGIFLLLSVIVNFEYIQSQSSQKSSNYTESGAYDPEFNKIIADAIKENAVEVSYDDLARYPDKFIEAPVHLTGKILQKVSLTQFRVNITRGEYSWKDTIYIFLESEARLLEDDEVNFYGLANGTITYESVVGNEITIPRVDVYEIKLLEEVEVAETIEMDVKTVKEKAVEATYDDLARYPDKMKEKPVYIIGKIDSKISKDRFKAQITKNYNYGFSYWEDEIIIRLRTDARLLEKDIVEFYGVANGTVDDSTPLVDVCETNVIGKDEF